VVLRSPSGTWEGATRYGRKEYVQRTHTALSDVCIRRPLWRHYYKNMNALIFVVDSNDRERLGTFAQCNVHDMHVPIRRWGYGEFGL
jgi:hypothetical protein